MPQNQLMMMRIIWAALLFSTITFLVAGYVSISSRSEPLMPDPIMLPALALVSVGIAAASVQLPRHLLIQSFQAAKYEVNDLPKEERMFQEARGRARRFANPDAVRSSLGPKVQTPFILSMALAEAVALNGFVLWFLGFPLTQAIGFFIVCWVLMIAHFPNPARYVQVLEKLYDADLK
jgi:F0F1-type ATP synthase membrane subunit c/vacuolar-type H+-ATPase subunit K